MSEGLNRVLLFGHLGADPELKMLQGGQAILKMRLATTEKYKDRNDQWVERTEWHSVSLWGRRAEALSKFLQKGERIFVEGSLRTSTYEKNGEKRYRTEINATNVILSGGGGRNRDDGDQSEGSGNGSRGRKRAPAPAPDDFGGGGGQEDDIPF